MAVAREEEKELFRKKTPAGKIGRCVRKLDCVCCRKVRGVVHSVFRVVQSNLGLLVVFSLYGGLGALLFSYLEGDEERKLRSELLKTRCSFLLSVELLAGQKNGWTGELEGGFESDENKIFGEGRKEKRGEYIEIVLEQVKEVINKTWQTRNNYTDKEEWLKNQTTFAQSVERLLGEYENYLKSLPAQILLYDSQSPMREWSYFQALFFCATVVTTIGKISSNFFLLF